MKVSDKGRLIQHKKRQQRHILSLGNSAGTLRLSEGRGFGCSNPYEPRNRTEVAVSYFVTNNERRKNEASSSRLVLASVGSNRKVRMSLVVSSQTGHFTEALAVERFALQSSELEELNRENTRLSELHAESDHKVRYLTEVIATQELQIENYNGHVTRLEIENREMKLQVLKSPIHFMIGFDIFLC